MNYRIGFGTDTHRLETGRSFFIGGIKIPHEKGALGHSDADALIHAICDALLGAANLGDIGNHFPDSDDKYKGMDSKILLKSVKNKISKVGYDIINIDSTIHLQQPKLASYIPKMKVVLSEILDIAESQISIKAKTGEKLGFIGREEGISVDAVVLISKKP
jgi:2-C-methyl-D-erythritol 2,4-cyclodiphosphate synthase